MNYPKREIIEYIIALIDEFAIRFGLTDRQAYRYIRFHNGISFIEDNYNVIHTLDFREAVESVALFCQKSGGRL